MDKECPIKIGLVSDSSWLFSQKLLQWRVLDLSTNEFIYENGLYSDTLYINNLGEYWGLVKSISIVYKNNLNIPCYCDSKTAISWVTKGKVNTSIDNSKLLELVKAGEDFINILLEFDELPEIIFWDKNELGENLADYGFK